MKKIAATVLLGVLSLLFLYPFVWMLLAGSKGNAEIFKPLQLLPKEWTLEHAERLLSGEWFPFWRTLANSAIVAGFQAIGAVAITAAAGFIFAKHQFRGKPAFFFAAILVILVPQQILAVPLFTWLNQLGLIDHLAGAMLPGMVSGLGIIFFTQIFRQVPNDLLDVARLEGASEPRVFVTLLPLISPALVSFGLIHFILAWHQHIVPLIVLSSEENRTLPLAISSLYGSSMRFPYAVLMVSSTIGLLPPVLLFALCYRHLKSALADLLEH
ncbi:MAG: multiple sugar transport system permease protein [Rhodothermales bacterium]|jgi:multiple sugar transport system permease protein